MQIFISLSGTSLSDLNEHAFVTKLMMMLSSCDYVEIGFLSFSTGLMGKWVVAVLLLTLQTICLPPPLLVFVFFSTFVFLLSFCILYCCLSALPLGFVQFIWHLTVWITATPLPPSLLFSNTSARHSLSLTVKYIGYFECIPHWRHHICSLLNSIWHLVKNLPCNCRPENGHLKFWILIFRKS